MLHYSLYELQRLQKIRLPRVVRADEEVDLLEVEGDVLEAFEVLDGNALEHGRPGF